MSKRNKMAFDSIEEPEILWKDRRRILGMPISFTIYQVDTDRLYLKKGLFNTESDELLLYRILDIKEKRSFGQKLCGVGTIVLYTADQSTRQLEIKSVKKSEKVRRFLSGLVEQQRTAKGLTGREIYGSAGLISGGDIDGDGIDDFPRPSFHDYD